MFFYGTLNSFVNRKISFFLRYSSSKKIKLTSLGEGEHSPPETSERQKTIIRSHLWFLISVGGSQPENPKRIGTDILLYYAQFSFFSGKYSYKRFELKFESFQRIFLICSALVSWLRLALSYLVWLTDGLVGWAADWLEVFCPMWSP